MSTGVTRLLRTVSGGWLVALALLTLPNCALSHATVPATPQTSVVFCDLPLAARPCAMGMDLAMGIPLSNAAVALAENRRSYIGLDFSQAARDACGGGPQAVRYRGSFPDGTPVCLNCGNVGAGRFYADTAAVCVERCEELFDGTGPPHTGLAIAHCTDGVHARVSTNFSPSAGAFCLNSACTSAGRLLTDFVDPRRDAVPAIWRDTVGVASGPGTLSSTTPTPVDPQLFPAGADTEAVIRQGDAYMDFTASGGTDTTRLIGFSEGPPDADTSAGTINYAFDLFRDGCFYRFERGVAIGGSPMAGCLTPNALGTYTTGKRFRISITDNHDAANTATITYIEMIGSCAEPAMCPQREVGSNPNARYPFRVDASFHELGGSLSDVRLVYIH